MYVAQKMDKHELIAIILLQLKREALDGRAKFIRDPNLDGRLYCERAESLIREGVLTAANAPQIVPPQDMPLITSPEYRYFNKEVLDGINLSAEGTRWRIKFQGVDHGKALQAKGFSRALDGCAWECMCVVTEHLKCFRYYTKRSGHLGRQVVRLVFNRHTGRLRWANCRGCVAAEFRPWCSHISMGFEYLCDIKEGRAISGACTDGRRPWGPNTLHVDARYHRSTLEFAILSGQAPLAFYTGFAEMPYSLTRPRMQLFLDKYKELNSSAECIHDPDDLIVEQNYGPSDTCAWVRKRRREGKELLDRRKRFHQQCMQDRDILQSFCNS